MEFIARALVNCHVYITSMFAFSHTQSTRDLIFVFSRREKTFQQKSNGVFSKKPRTALRLTNLFILVIPPQKYTG